jgi:hypothetical protein
MWSSQPLVAAETVVAIAALKRRDAVWSTTPGSSLYRGTVSVISTAIDTVIGSIRVGVGDGPSGVAVTPDRELAPAGVLDDVDGRLTSGPANV